MELLGNKNHRIIKEDALKTFRENVLAEDYLNELESYIPEKLKRIKNLDNLIPKIAKDKDLLKEISVLIKTIPSHHKFVLGDAREKKLFEDESVHLILTSPPYWNLKKYRDNKNQLGDIADYRLFLMELKKVIENSYNSLVQGGRMICVVGDVLLSRKKNNGTHSVMPLHASIQELAVKIGFSNLTPIIWNKISNIKFEVNNGSSFLGKPYEPNGIIKSEIEYILMLRKPGGYRKPSKEARSLSIISDEDHKKWFKQIWSDVTGASTKEHPAPYPLELAQRLIKMYSFVGDTVLDPFLGSGTTSIAAAFNGRNSIGIEVDENYLEKSINRFNKETNSLFSNYHIEINNKGNDD